MPHHRGMHRTVALTLALVACTRGPTDPAAGRPGPPVPPPLALAACPRGPTDPAAGRPGPPAPGRVQLANPTATFNQLQAISAVTNTAIFESFSVLAPFFAPPGSATARSLALATFPRELAARYAPWNTPSFPLSTSWRGGQGVRTQALGTTFVWDPATNSYIASSDSGAPANGERFILYALSQRTGLPSVPLTAIGYVDLTHASAGATAN